jgi:hypothetical protein
VRKKGKAKEKELVQDADWDIAPFSEWGGYRMSMATMSCRICADAS